MQAEKRRRQQRGFTLLELIVVIAIIGLLAATIMPSFGGFGEKARRTVCYSYLQTIARAYQYEQADFLNGAAQGAEVVQSTFPQAKKDPTGSDVYGVRFTGLCPSGGTYVIKTGVSQLFEDGGAFNITCTKHGSLKPEDYAPTFTTIMGMAEVKDYFSKSNGLKTVDSLAPSSQENQGIAGIGDTVRNALAKEMGIDPSDMNNYFWQIRRPAKVGGKDNNGYDKASFEIYITRTDVSRMTDASNASKQVEGSVLKYSFTSKGGVQFEGEGSLAIEKTRVANGPYYLAFGRTAVFQPTKTP